MEAPKVYPAPLRFSFATQEIHSPWADGEVFLLRIGIGPDEIRHRPFVRDLSKAVDDLDLIDMVD